MLDSPRKFLKFIPILFSVVIFGLGNSVGAYAAPSIFSSEEDSIQYTILKFDRPKKEQKFPLLIVLHGSAQTPEGYLKIWKEEAARRKIMVLAPAVNFAYEDNPKDLEKFYKFLERIIREYPVDSDRVYIAGISSGALVARWLVVQNPSFWRGAVFIASPPQEKWMNYVDVKKMPPILYVHGGEDKLSDVHRVIEDVGILKRQGARIDFWEDANAGHEQQESWNKKILDWLTRQTIPE